MKSYGLYVWVHKSSKRLKVSEPKMYMMNNVITRGLGNGVQYTKRPSAFEYDEMNIHVMG